MALWPNQLHAACNTRIVLSVKNTAFVASTMEVQRQREGGGGGGRAREGEGEGEGEQKANDFQHDTSGYTCVPFHEKCNSGSIVAVVVVGKGGKMEPMFEGREGRLRKGRKKQHNNSSTNLSWAQNADLQLFKHPPQRQTFLNLTLHARRRCRTPNVCTMTV